MQIERQFGDERVTLDVEPDGDGWRVRLPDGSEHHVTAIRHANDVLQVTAVDGSQEANVLPSALAAPESLGIRPSRVFRVPFARSGSDAAFFYDGNAYTFSVPATRASGRKDTAASGVLTAPMSGIVADVLVTVGQQVEARQPLVILEAMKVMTTLEAPFAGTVTSLTVEKKQQIGRGALVVEVTAQE